MNLESFDCGLDSPDQGFLGFFWELLLNAMKVASDNLRLGWGVGPSSLPFRDGGDQSRCAAGVLCIQLRGFAPLQFGTVIESAWVSCFSLLLLGSVRLVAACMSFREITSPSSLFSEATIAPAGRESLQLLCLA